MYQCLTIKALKDTIQELNFSLLQKEIEYKELLKSNSEYFNKEEYENRIQFEKAVIHDYFLELKKKQFYFFFKQILYICLIGFSAYAIRTIIQKNKK